MITGTYREVFTQIKDGDIVFVKNRHSPFMNLIRWFTKSKYVHVGIAFWMTTGDKKYLMMVEAQAGTTLRIVKLSRYGGGELDVYTPLKSWVEIEDAAFERLSDEVYGYIEALWVGIVEAFHHYLHIELPRKNFRGEICSEFVARLQGVEEKHVSPQFLAEELLEAGSEIKIAVIKE